LKQHKHWFDEEFSKLLDQSKQVKLKWLQNQSQTNGDNLKNVTYQTRKTFRNKKRECLKEKFNKPETNNKSKSIQDLYREVN
jgi:hypothetical protein